MRSLTLSVAVLFAAHGGCSDGDGGGSGGAAAAGGGASSSQGGGGGSIATKTSTATGGDGGAPGGVGDCESEVSAVAGGCIAAYACEGGAIRIVCGADAEDVGASCDCLVDDVVQATCTTSDDGEDSDGAQCGEEDNCCLAALGASRADSR